MTTVKNAIQTYKDAMSELTDAVNALDQAHSALKDLDLHRYISAKLWGRYVDIEDVVNIADALLGDLQRVICPDCNQPMAESEDCLSGQCPEVNRG